MFSKMQTLSAFEATFHVDILTPLIKYLMTPDIVRLKQVSVNIYQKITELEIHHGYNVKNLTAWKADICSNHRYLPTARFKFSNHHFHNLMQITEALIHTIYHEQTGNECMATFSNKKQNTIPVNCLQSSDSAIFNRLMFRENFQISKNNERGFANSHSPSCTRSSFAFSHPQVKLRITNPGNYGKARSELNKILSALKRSPVTTGYTDKGDIRFHLKETLSTISKNTLKKVWIQNLITLLANKYIMEYISGSDIQTFHPFPEHLTQWTAPRIRCCDKDWASTCTTSMW